MLTPFFLGSVVGGVASGRVPASGTGSLLRSWLNPTSMLGGVLAVVVCAFLAAVYLTADADRQRDAALTAYFRDRAITSGVVAGKRHLLERPSGVFDVLCKGDQRRGTTAAWTYYERAMALAHEVGTTDVHVSHLELAALEQYPWPGNVRELENCVERLVVLVENGQKISMDVLPLQIRAASDGAGMLSAPSPAAGVAIVDNRSLPEMVESYEKRLLADTMRRCGGNQSEAAKRLKIPRQTLRNRLLKLGLAASE